MFNFLVLEVEIQMEKLIVIKKIVIKLIRKKILKQINLKVI